MNNNNLFTKTQLMDYSSLFMRKEVQLWMKEDFSSVDVKIKRYDQQWGLYKNATYYDYLKYVYSILETHYQNEYILKNTFLTHWLIKELGETDSKVFSEFRVGNSIADIAMFNGHSKVFEIKTEYDTDRRLQWQLESYRKVFNQIFLIISKTKLSVFKKYEKDIGIITFDNKQMNKFEIYRESPIIPIVDATTIMDILHTKEYKTIVEIHYGELPKMTSFNQYNICNELIRQIPNEKLNTYFINQMKRRKSEYALSKRYHVILNQISLALKLNKADKTNMINRIKTPLKTL